MGTKQLAKQSEKSLRRASRMAVRVLSDPRNFTSKLQAICVNYALICARCSYTNVVWHAYSRHPYSTYAVFTTTLFPPAIIIDGLLFFCLHRALTKDRLVLFGSTYRTTMCFFFAFWFISKWVKSIGHYSRYPSDMLLIPVSILFGWFHGIIKIKAFFTMNQVRQHLALLVCKSPSLLPQAVERLGAASICA